MNRFRGIGLRAISLNTFFQIFGRLIGSGTSLLITLIIASFMGYSSIGSFVKITEFVMMFNLLIDFGINPVFQRIYKDDLGKKMGNLILLRILIAFLLIPLIFIVTAFLPAQTSSGGGFSSLEKNGIFIFSLTLIQFAINSSLLGFIQYKLASKLAIIPTIISSIVTLSIVYYASTNQNLSFILFSFIVSSSLYAVVLYSIIRKVFNLKLVLAKSFYFSKVLLMEAWPLGLVLLINYLYARLDIFLLSLLKPSVEVGVYGISYRFFDVVIAVPTFLAASTYPLLIKVMDKPATYYSNIRKYLFFYGFVSFAGTIIVLLSSPLIQILRKEFLLSVMPLQILSLSLPFFFLTSILQWHFVIRKKILMLLPIYLFVLILNLILNLIFIPKFSYFASAVITGLCEGVVFLILLFFFLHFKRRTLKTNK